MNNTDAQVWNQPRASKPEYYISKTGYYLNQYIVNEDHNGWAINISPVFSDLEQAQYFLQGVQA
jgi:hypothetical protein